MSFSLIFFIFLPSFTLALPKRSLPYEIYFTYQPETHLGEWIDLLTLCFAPLVAHLAFGIGRVIMLQPRVGHTCPKPRWTDHLTRYNPVSIIWRYYAIIDRRVRAKKWDRREMLLSNIVLWNGENWDGRESVGNDKDYDVKIAGADDTSRISLVSSSAVKTITIALQGVQAINNILHLIWPSIPGGFRDGVGYMFVPISLLGIMRLPAALWLADDVVNGITEIKARETKGENEKPFNVNMQGLDERFKENTPFVILFRIFWALAITTLVACSWGAALVGFIRQSTSTLSGLLERLMYLVLTGGLFFIHMIYVWKGFRGERTQLVIPCIGMVWYKIYTFVLILIAVAAFTAQCLETRRITCGNSCGSYTLSPWPKC